MKTLIILAIYVTISCLILLYLHSCGKELSGNDDQSLLGYEIAVSILWPISIIAGLIIWAVDRLVETFEKEKG